MKKLNRMLLGILLLLLLAVTLTVAMTSTQYRLDWFTPLESSGGGVSSSAHYTVHYTTGQLGSGAQQGTSYRVGLGFWQESSLVEWHILLPIVQR